MTKSFILQIFTCFFANAAILKSLPGVSKFKSDQYTGYLNVTNNYHLHYWFIESQRSPSSDPLILWLTGGPGCSSLFAMFTEIGPYLVTLDGQTLIENLSSWDKIANVLYLESPVGVGFSSKIPRNYEIDDNIAAKDNYAALVAFFEEFPQFKKNDLYLAGESYAGIYVPMLSELILQQSNENKMNLKGIIVGNGASDLTSLPSMFVPFAYYHGYVDESLWQTVKRTCCNGSLDECFNGIEGEPLCLQFYGKVMRDVAKTLVDLNNMYADCPYHGRKREKRHEFESPLKTEDSLNCKGTDAVEIYLNLAEVREALSINRQNFTWGVCSSLRYERNQIKVPDQVKKATDAKLKLLFYYGNLDLLCFPVHGERFIKKLGYQVSEPKHRFTVDGSFAGMRTRYGNIEIFIIYGAGHMVPMDKPKISLEILKYFINRPNYETLKASEDSNLTTDYLKSKIFSLNDEQLKTVSMLYGQLSSGIINTRIFWIEIILFLIVLLS